MTGGRTWFGDATLVAFLVAQLCDGALTYVGIQMFGSQIEANPVLAWYIAATGMGAGILLMKMLAVACGALLHLQARHRTIGVLTILYLWAAVRPWTDLLVSIGP